MITANRVFKSVLVRIWFKSVDFPAPKNPVNIVIGVLESVLLVSVENLVISTNSGTFSSIS